MKTVGHRELLKFKATPLLRRAIKLRAALFDLDLQGVIVEVLTKGLDAELREVEKRGLLNNLTEETQDNPAGRGKKGKKNE
jgi:hypothetical protein